MEQAVILGEMKGHQDSVNSLSVSGNWMASGSDDSTIRVWDLRTQKSVRRAVDLAFYPADPVDNVFLNETMLVATSNYKIFVFDLKNPNEILVNSSTTQYELQDVSNQISFYNGQFAVPNDSGEIQIFSSIENRDLAMNSILSQHGNICTSFSFYNENLGVSGGFDCILKLWDIPCSKLIEETAMGEIYGGSGINPPHIYSMSSNGHELGIGLGNGYVLYYDTTVDHLNPIRNIEAHLGRVSQVSWAGWDRNLMMSASDDLTLALWSNEDLMRRIAIPSKPNWLESSISSPQMFIATPNKEISVLSIRS